MLKSPRSRSAILMLSALSAAAAPGTAAQDRPVAPTAEEIIDRSIRHHDPKGSWATRHIRLELHTTYSEKYAQRTGSQDAMLTIHLAPGHEEFRYLKESGADRIEISMERGNGTTVVNGNSSVTDEERKRLRLREPKFYRDYCEYLYGMPMKLKDPGTILDRTVERTRFNDRDVLQVRITYDPNVGADTWYFYFEPSSFALVGYRFYHDESANDGEYITLEDEIVDQSSGLRLPKLRSWYYNANDGYLATDDIISISTQ